MTESPTHKHRRFVINFAQVSLDQASKVPHLINIVRSKVKPERDALPPKNSTNRKRRELWWQFGAFPVNLDTKRKQIDEILVHPNLTSNSLKFAKLPARTIVAAPHVVITDSSNSIFSILTSKLHEEWCRLQNSSFKDDLRYTPSKYFETFPFPDNWLECEGLESIGLIYYDFRANLMVENDEGLTITYNRFHSPEDSSPEIYKLRELHSAIDRAVLDAYGWTDISTDCEFIPDYYEEDKDGNEVPKSIRYRWPDEVSDEVLASLLALNAERAKQEQLDGTAAKKTAKKKTAKKRAAKKKTAKKSSNVIELVPPLTDLPGIAAWEPHIDSLSPSLPTDMRFCLKGASVNYYRFYLRALLAEAGGSLSFTLLQTAVEHIRDHTLLKQHSPAAPADLKQWENQFKENTEIAGYTVAIEQLLVTSGEALIVGAAPDFEIRATNTIQTYNEPWIKMDAQLSLQSAIAAERAHQATKISSEMTQRLKRWMTTA